SNFMPMEGKRGAPYGTRTPVSAVKERLRCPALSMHVRKCRLYWHFMSLRVHPYPATCMPYVCRTGQGVADGADASRRKTGYPCSTFAAQKAAGALLALDSRRAGGGASPRGHKGGLELPPP